MVGVGKDMRVPARSVGEPRSNHGWPVESCFWPCAFLAEASGTRRERGVARRGRAPPDEAFCGAEDIVLVVFSVCFLESVLVYISLISIQPLI